MATAGLCATERRKPGLSGERELSLSGGQQPGLSDRQQPGRQRQTGTRGLSGPRKPGLRLTRRGRVAVAGASALLVAVAMAVALLEVGTGTAQATSHAIPRPVAERNLAQITVRPGQSLWSVAEAADPDADTRIVIQQIIELNALSGTVIQPGERLWVPRG